jgi:predicted RNA-binding protein
VNHWLLTITPENWKATKELGISVQGFTSRQRKKVERMVPGDKLLFYIKDVRVFPATATVTSTCFEERDTRWKTFDPNETFPHRVRLRPVGVMPEGKELDAGLIVPRLEYLKRWPPERWPLALMGELHIIPRHDFEIIEWEMLKSQRPGWLPPVQAEEDERRKKRRGPFLPQGQGAGQRFPHPQPQQAMGQRDEEPEAAASPNPVS